MKKILILLLITIPVLIIINEIGKRKSFLSYFKNQISSETKYKIKKYLLPYKTINVLEKEIDQTNNQFLLKEMKVKKELKKIIFRGNRHIKIFNKTMKLNLFNNVNQIMAGINRRSPGSAYLEFFEDNLIIVSGAGIIAYAANTDEENIIFTQIENNLNDIVNFESFIKKDFINIETLSIKDVLIDNNKIYISYTNQISEKCWNTSIVYANMNYDRIKFERLFEPSECVPEEIEFNEFNAHQSGGRIINYDDENILFTTGEYRYRKNAQEKNSIFGKILKINLNTKNYEPISMGHRNPQGLTFDKKNKLILSTEHGPYAGDEINIFNPTTKDIPNFGWPISSYGNHYTDEKNNKAKYKLYPLNKSHEEYGFKEPLKYFVPSIGISEIITFGDKKYIFSAMRAQKIYLLSLNDKFELEQISEIEIGERVRDMIYVKKLNKIFLFLEDSASIAIIQDL